jgi:hypothetical protein
MLTGAALIDHPSVEGEVFCEDEETTPVVLLYDCRGVSLIRPIGGGELIVISGGVRVLLQARRSHSCLNK